MEPTAVQLENRQRALRGEAPINPRTLSQFSDNPSQPNVAAENVNDKIISTLSSQISSLESEPKTIMERFAERRRLAQEGGEAEQELIRSRFGEDIEEAETTGERNLTAELESRQGFATNTGVVRLLTEETQKNIRQLKKDRDELLLLGKATQAERLDNLIVQETEAISNARTNLLNTLVTGGRELRERSAEERAKLSFETPTQQRAAQFEQTRKQTLLNLQTTYPDVSGIEGAESIAQALELIGPRVSEDRKREIALQDAQLRLANANIAAANAKAAAAANDFSNGILEEKTLKQIDGSPQGKKLRALDDLRTSASRYETLVDDYGFEFSGAGKTALDSAYADLQIKWKEAANLGALTGPDLDLIIDSVKPVTGFRGLSAIALGGGVEGIQGGITKMITNIDEDGAKNFNQLLLRNPVYANSQYVQSLGLPFIATANQQQVEQDPNLTSDGTALQARPTPGFVAE